MWFNNKNKASNKTENENTPDKSENNSNEQIKYPERAAKIDLDNCKVVKDICEKKNARIKRNPIITGICAGALIIVVILLKVFTSHGISHSQTGNNISSADRVVKSDSVKQDVTSSNNVQATDSRTLCPSDMKLIADGLFNMGGNAGDEYPRHTVSLLNYCIDQYEVTNEKYQRFSPSHISFEGSRGSQQPVTNVPWSSAKQYCESQNKRLCSENEWEKACSGPNNNIYPYGNTYESGKCWVGRIEEESKDIGSFYNCTNEYSVYDMSGNVSEWTSATYDPYPGGSWEKNMGKGYKVHRGGHWGADERKSRCSQRGYITNAETGNNIVGFRCCANAGQ